MLALSLVILLFFPGLTFCCTNLSQTFFQRKRTKAEEILFLITVTLFLWISHSNRVRGRQRSFLQATLELCLFTAGLSLKARGYLAYLLCAVGCKTTLVLQLLHFYCFIFFKVFLTDTISSESSTYSLFPLFWCLSNSVFDLLF